MRYSSASSAVKLLSSVAGLCLAAGVAMAQAPVLLTLRPEQLTRAKAQTREATSVLRPALMQLLTEADAAMKAGPFSVMQKERVPPSGNRHDYMSLAPYWWPDSSKPGGLPYVRKDGYRNPQTQDDSATRMHPNLEYGQAIPGITDGRGIGIIETRGLPRLLDAIAMLEHSASWTTRDRTELRSWMTAYLHWLRTSKNGRDERAATNNHGTWYDAQTAALALFVGQRALAYEILEASKTWRIAVQIEPAGSQPLELARTRSWDYSVMNLEGLMQLAELGRTAGVDLWHYASPDGRSIRKTLDYLAAYQGSSRTWTRQQITPVSPIRLLEALTIGELVYGHPTYSELIAKMPQQQVRVSRVQLLYPRERESVAPLVTPADLSRRSPAAFRDVVTVAIPAKGALTYDLAIHTGGSKP